MKIIDLYRNTYNPSRQLLPLAYIKHMPFKVVGEGELHDLKCELDFNTPHEYGLESEQPNRKLKLKRGEVGHNQLYRLILAPHNNHKEKI